MKLLKYIIICVGMLVSFSEQGQAQISGKIFDKSSLEPIQGALIQYAETSLATVTDEKGFFTLTEASNTGAGLNISFLGYKNIYYELTGKSEIQVAMQTDAVSLESVIVSASREAGLRTQAPIAVAKISSRIIDETKANAAYEIINKAPGVLMVNYNNEQHGMSIRQPMTTNAYFLYLEDGLPIRPMGVFNHNAILEMNQFTVSNIEVVRGPVSSIYGPEAVGGAVNFISQKPTAMFTSRVGVQADNWGYKRVQYGTGGTIGKFGFYLGGLVSDQKDAWITSSDYTKHSQYGRFEYQLSKSAKLISTITWTDYDSQTSGSVDSTAFYSRSYVSTTNFTYRKAFALRGRLTLEKDWNANSKSFLTAYGRNNRLGQNPSYSIRWNSGAETATGQINSNDFQSYGLLGQHSQKFKFWDSKLTTGLHLDASPNQYSAYQIDLSAKLRADKKSVEQYTIIKERPEIKLADYDADIRNAAAYVQLDFTPINRLRISLGGRYDHMYFNYTNFLDKDKVTGESITGDKAYKAFTPKIGLTYEVNRNAGLYANHSEGFAPSSLSAIFRKRNIPTDEGELFYYNLVPATFSNNEVGGWISLLSNKMYLDLTYYNMSGKNELLSIRQADNSFDYQAAGKSSHQGIEFGSNYKPIDQISVRWGGAYARHKFESFILSTKESDLVKNVDGKDMPNAPNWIWNGEISYYPKFAKGLRTSLEWQHVADYYQNQVNSVKADGFDLFNFRIGYQIKGIEAFVNVINVTDQLYATQVTRGNGANDRSAYNAAAPRTFVFGIQYSFIGK